MIGRDPIEYERHVSAARLQLNTATFKASWEEGHKLSLEQAIAEALEV